MSIRVGIIGATGYTALEAARLISRHHHAHVTLATSRGEEGKRLSDVHPSLVGRTEVRIQSFQAEMVAENCDVVMCCLPHGASAETVKTLATLGVRCIDFSADFRLSDLSTYEKWYEVKHPWPERIGTTVYGLPEFFSDEIRKADVVANPGCYPTSVILPIAPLLRSGMIDSQDVIADSKSGVSGAGRTPKLNTLYCEANESIAAYSVAGHRHQPEMIDLLKRIGGTTADVLFTPHLTPMDQGILSTIYTIPARNTTAKSALECLRATYANSPFVKIVDHLPSTKHVRGTNYVHISARDAGRRMILICAIDNLIKGASGAAVQNMNVMFGFDETEGLF